MAPKKSAREPAPSSLATTQASSTAAGSVPAKAAKPSANSGNVGADIVLNLWNHYVDSTPQRTKLIDIFMAFLVIVGGIQFLYCLLFGNFPFNAFLSGFSATVGQFVLAASLRIQTSEANKTEFPGISPERAFTDFIFGSLILHFFVINFIN